MDTQPNTGDQTVPQRILWLVDYCKANRKLGIRFDKDFIKVCSLPNLSYISDLRSGKISSPSFEAVANIVKKTGVNFEWVADGKGSPFGSHSIETNNKENLKRFRNQLERQLQSTLNTIAVIDKLLNAKDRYNDTTKKNI